MIFFLFILNLICHSRTHFSIVIPSFNNIKLVDRNLCSALAQDYNNFEVIFIDDSSTDGTFERANQISTTIFKGSPIKLFQNKKRKGALENYFYAIHNYCRDDSVVVTLDGDDWLANNNVLKKLDDIYTSNNCWLTYGQFRYYPQNPYPEIQERDGDLGMARYYPHQVIRERSFRTYREFYATHLRTFYCWLFKKIKEEDLLDENNSFYTMSWDMAFMFPMLEMCGSRFFPIMDILYFYNCENPLNDWRVEGGAVQEKTANKIKKKPQYPIIE